MLRNRLFDCQAQSPQRCFPPLMVRSLLGVWIGFFVNVQCLGSYRDVLLSYESIC